MPKDDDMKVFSLRLPNAMLQELAELANGARRSVNSEILIALEMYSIKRATEKAK